MRSARPVALSLGPASGRRAEHASRIRRGTLRESYTCGDALFGQSVSWRLEISLLSTPFP